MNVIFAVHIDAAGGVPDDVVREGDVFYRRPWRGAAIVAHGKENGKAVLGMKPVVLEDVPVHEYPLHLLQLEQVLDAPGRLGPFPSERLMDVVVAELEVRGHEPGCQGIGATKDYVFSRPFEVVVYDL